MLRSVRSSSSHFIKLFALICLCLQNSALILSTRYSRSILKQSYSSSTCVVMMELMKFILSALLVLKDGNNSKHLLNLIKKSLVMAIPGLLYVLQNSCQFYALKHLEASVFSILSQLKILTAAICSVLILRTQLSWRKWRALVLLVIGAILVQYQPNTNNTKETVELTTERNVFLGLLSVLAMVILSGLAGIYLEKFLKASETPGLTPPTIWERNFQLSYWGILFGIMTLVFSDYENLMEKGFFGGWTWFTWWVVILAAVGGLIVAVVVKYTDTIIKGFASSLSIVLTSLLSLILFDVELDFLFWIGASCVLISIFNYNEADAVTSSNTGGSIERGNYVPLAQKESEMQTISPVKDEHLP